MSNEKVVCIRCGVKATYVREEKVLMKDEEKPFTLVGGACEEHREFLDSHWADMKEALATETPEPVMEVPGVKVFDVKGRSH